MKYTVIYMLHIVNEWKRQGQVHLRIAGGHPGCQYKVYILYGCRLSVMFLRGLVKVLWFTLYSTNRNVDMTEEEDNVRNIMLMLEN